MLCSVVGMVQLSAGPTSAGKVSKSEKISEFHSYRVKNLHHFQRFALPVLVFNVCLDVLGSSQGV